VIKDRTILSLQIFVYDCEGLGKVSDLEEENREIDKIFFTYRDVHKG